MDVYTPWIRLAASLLAMVMVCGPAMAQKSGPVGPVQLDSLNRPDADVKAYSDPDSKLPTRSFRQSDLQFPATVLESTDEGMVKIKVANKAYWFDQSDFTTSRATGATCLVSNASPTPGGTSRGANEGCRSK